MWITVKSGSGRLPGAAADPRSPPKNVDDVNNLRHHASTSVATLRLYSHRVGTVHSHRRNPQVRIRFGYLRQLPKDYQGERHREIAKYLPAINGQEWVEFVEVPGPGPNQPPPDPWLPRCINVVFVEPYPAQLNAP